MNGEENSGGFGWLWVWVTSLALTAAMVAIWLNYECCSPKIDVLTSTHEQVDALASGADRQASVRLPTGIFVQSLAFVSSHDVEVTGRIWQRVPAGATLPDGVEPGVIFPDAISKHSDNLDVIYDDVVLPDGGRLTLWNFQVTLRQFFAYNDYPLDGKLVWVRFWTQDLNNRVLLVPDLDAYSDTSPDAIFGVSESLVPGEWTVRSSFFGYENQRYDTDFGRETGIKGKELSPQPELRFHVLLSRDFSDAFIINLVPLFVSFGLLFGLLMTVTRREELAGRLGFDTLAVFGSCAGLFFIVLLGHIQLRQDFAGSQIVYLEYFYIVSYVAILAVSLFAFALAFGADTHQRRLLRNDGWAVKQLFWPVLLAVLLAITIWQLLWIGPRF